MVDKRKKKSKKMKGFNSTPIFVAGLCIPLIGYLGSLDIVQDYIQDFIGKKEPIGITELWFTSKTYAKLPGLFFGTFGGLFGVLSGLIPSMLIFNKNKMKYFNILSIIIMLIFIGGIVFGVVASFYNQPKSVVFGFIQGGFMALLIIGILWYTFNEIEGDFKSKH